MDTEAKMANEQKVVFMAGAAGSGKSYIRARDAELMDLPVVDADQFKAAHPDYDPKNPGALHIWSNEQAMDLYLTKLEGTDTFIYDGTGTNPERYVTMMRQSQRAGFATEIVYVEVTRATSIRRNNERERTIPEFIVNEQHDFLPSSIEIIFAEADSSRTINND